MADQVGHDGGGGMTEKWYFSVVDVIEALTDSSDPNTYRTLLQQRLIFFLNIQRYERIGVHVIPEFN